jgi:hypothetical protein
MALPGGGDFREVVIAAGVRPARRAAAKSVDDRRDPVHDPRAAAYSVVRT